MRKTLTAFAACLLALTGLQARTIVLDSPDSSLRITVTDGG